MEYIKNNAKMIEILETMVNHDKKTTSELFLKIIDKYFMLAHENETDL